MIWNWDSTRPELGIPGRRDPKSSSALMGAPANTYFLFDNSNWERSFGVATWGDHSVGDTADPANNDLVYFHARQCRYGPRR